MCRWWSCREHIKCIFTRVTSLVNQQMTAFWSRVFSYKAFPQCHWVLSCTIKFLRCEMEKYHKQHLKGFSCEWWVNKITLVKSRRITIHERCTELVFSLCELFYVLSHISHVQWSNQMINTFKVSLCCVSFVG